MLRSSIALALLVLPLAAASPPGGASCPVSGIQTTNFGTGTGFLAPSVLAMAWNPATCSIEHKLDAPTCCNVIVSQHFIALGTQADPVGLSLASPPFYAGSLFYLTSLAGLFGPFPGTTGSIPVPPDPALVGFGAPVQAVLFFFTTIGATIDLGVSQGVFVLFQ